MTDEKTVSPDDHLPASAAEREEMGIGGFWEKIKGLSRKLPFAEDAVTAWYCATDPTTPTAAKALLVGALAYFVLPTDAVPDFIAALGFTDDAAVFYAALRTLGQNVRPEHRDQARKALAAREAGKDSSDL
ncbi:MAG: YkvA family protein [Magnetovibrionaceae bacterium]